MNDSVPPLIAESTSDARSRSLVDDVRQLAEDGKTLLEAELAYQKSRAALAGQGVKGAAAWGVLALMLLFFTLMAVVMGSLLALAPLLGGWLAMAVVVLVLLGATALSVWLALRRWQAAAAHLADKEPAA